LKKTDFVVRFAGEGGQGFLTAATGFARANAQAGYHAQTFATFPSQITGGPTFMQARVSTEQMLSRGDALDVLVVFNEDAYEEHKDDVKPDGLIVYDSDKLQVADDSRGLGIPFDKLAKSTGNLRAANMVMMGALAGLVGVPQAILEEFVRKRWGNVARYGEDIIPQNIHAMTLGRESAAESGFSLGELAEPIVPEYDQIFLNGNQAISLGAAHAGVNFFAGYPISPATTILLWMEANLVGEGQFAYQVSSEIEAITALIGASYGGAKAMTSTAGPGLSLMSEGLGLAWMAEIPLVVVDVQRGGPATGLPTKTEQSDLLAALKPSHGDLSVPVIAPGTVEECFYGAVAAVNWAERYQGPVILLSEHALSEREQNIRKPDLNNVKVENRLVYTGDNGYRRYEGGELSAMPIPGNPGSYVANASEHDPLGDTTHLGSRHVEMTDRRFSKLNLLLDGTYESENTDARIALMPWGGSKGPSLEAYQKLVAADMDIAWYYTMYLNPLPPKLLEELKEKDLVLVPELNYLGQLSSVLRAEGVKAESITQYTGLPLGISDLVKRVTKRVAAPKQEGITA